jgi:hypothetical protein
MRPNPFVYVLLALIALNLAVGAAAYRYLGRIDADYSRLLGEGIPFLNNMQSVTALSSRTYALMVDRAQARSPEQAARIEAELDRVRAEADACFASPLNDRAIPADLRPAFDDIRRFREGGRERRTKYLTLLRDGHTAEASDYLRDDIYAAHRAFLSKLDVFCDAYQERFARLNQELNDANQQSRNFLFGLSALPVAIIAGGLLLVLGFVLVLFAYRPDIIVTPKGQE